MHALLLLVGRVVLFIHHDESEIGIGQEQRRARAHHHLHLIRRHRGPSARAGAWRQLRMPFRGPGAEARGETIERLPGERDLRHQDQGLSLVADVFGDALEIDFRLAGAGDAVEQGDRVAALIDGGAQRVGGGQLHQRKIRLAKIRIGRLRHRLGRQHHGLQRAFVDQPVDDANADAGFLRGLSLRAGEPIGE